MSEEELNKKIVKYTEIVEELTKRMTILTEGGLNITEELRQIQNYSPEGIEEPEMMENRTLDLEQQYEKLQRVYNEMNNAQTKINEALQNTIQELDKIVSTNKNLSTRSSTTRSSTTRSSTRRRTSGRGISKKKGSNKKRKSTK